MEKGPKEKKTVESYLAAYNLMDVERMASLFSDDCLFENISNHSPSIKCVGIQEFKALAEKSLSLFSAREQVVTNWVLGKDKAAVEIDYTAILAKDIPGGPKRGETLRLKGVSIFEFNEGKICRLVDFS